MDGARLCSVATRESTRDKGHKLEKLDFPNAFFFPFCTINKYTVSRAVWLGWYLTGCIIRKVIVVERESK